jgi:hypothetical protein
MSRLSEREAQAKAIEGKDRDQVEEENPIIFAETAPCHYQSATFWFPEGDSVEVVENLDWEEEIEVFYQEKDKERVQLHEGALYDWALEQYQNA